MTILGLSCYYHDSAACLLRNGVPVAMAEEERFSRKKHDNGFPKLAIEFCLKELKITAKDLDAVVFYEKPFVKFERIFLTVMNEVPHTRKLFTESMREWLTNKLWIKAHLSANIGIAPEKIYFCDHHLSHAASAFYPSGFDEAAVLTLDGVGEWATGSVWKGSDTTLTPVVEQRFPHSVGLLYSAFTAYLGFEVNDGEYKVMGMAPFGKPRYVRDVKKLFTFFPDGSIELDLSYFHHHRSPDIAYTDKFISLFGRPREPKSLFFTKASGFPIYFGNKPANFSNLAKSNQYFADLAASLQKVTEEIVVASARYALKVTKSRNLCFAGGVALNSVANGKIATKLPLKGFFVQPAAGDSGGALGAALYFHHHIQGNKRTYTQTHAYYGKAYTDSEIKNYLTKNNIPYKKILSEKKLLETVVDALVVKKIVGWYQGKFEWGPRALGNRSILADPRSADIKDIVNAKIKFREPYRPFAPAVLEEHAHEFFEFTSLLNKNGPAKFMILVLPVKKNKQKIIPAVTHVDGSGRLQTVDTASNPRYYKLIKRFGEETGVPVLLNTSFNLKGDPIVNTPDNAYQTFLKSDMDMLVLENYVVIK